MADLARDRLEEEASETIQRVVATTGLTEDIATLLLIRYKWDESKLNSDFSQSEEYHSIARYFVDDPHFDWKMTRCLMCNTWDGCQNLGCDHYICGNCIRVDVELKVFNGHLELMCPFSRCGKFVSPQFIKDSVCAQALHVYNLTLLESLRRSRPPMEETIFERMKKFVVELILFCVKEIQEIICGIIKDAIQEYARYLVEFLIRYIRERFF